MSREHLSVHEINDIRENSRSDSEKAMFEIDVITGNITWANSYVLEKQGQELSQIQSLSLFDVIPEEFHESVRNFISDIQKGLKSQSVIIPSISSDNKIVWWYIRRIHTKSHFSWLYANHMSTTKRLGSEYAFMTSALRAVDSHNELVVQVSEFRAWTEGEITHLKEKDAEQDSKIDAILEDNKQIKKLAKTSADISLQTQQSIEVFKSEVFDGMSKQTGEILRLIKTDTDQQKRMEELTEHANQLTAIAVQAISTKAAEAGSGITKNVAAAAGLATSLVGILNWVITSLSHSHIHFSSLFHWF